MAAAAETLGVAVPPAPGTLMETQPSAQKLAQRRRRLMEKTQQSREGRAFG